MLNLPKVQGKTVFEPDSFISVSVLVSREAKFELKIPNAVFSKRKTLRCLKLVKDLLLGNFLPGMD